MQNKTITSGQMASNIRDLHARVKAEEVGAEAKLAEAIVAVRLAYPRLDDAGPQLGECVGKALNLLRARGWVTDLASAHQDRWISRH